VGVLLSVGMHHPDDLLAYPSFHLRFDFAYEIGFVDRLRTPVSREKFAARYRRSIQDGGITYDQYVDVVNCRQVPRFVGLFTYILPDRLDVVPGITGGGVHVRVDYAGLFEDAVRKTSAVLGRPVCECPILLSTPSEVQTNVRYPGAFLMHDAERARAFLLPWSRFDWLAG
jgi:hypothetical protein